jgi:signal transduction histidine kinase
MTSLERVIFLISADAPLTQQFISELVASGGHYQVPLAVSVGQALKGFRRVRPTAILLDESAVPSPMHGEGTSESLEALVASLAEFAPVVVVAAPERQTELAYLIYSGTVDFVARVGAFFPVALAFLERRVRLVGQAEQTQVGADASLAESAADFGEVLRHEVNNPLTGILGNAELLLAEHKKKEGEQLSPAAIQRLQTIAQLAVRLRETVRRLSNAWDSRHDHARSA